MVVASAGVLAQRIPAHIIEDIGNHVSYPPYQPAIDELPPSKCLSLSSDIVALVQLCRRWRAALHSRVNRACMLKIWNRPRHNGPQIAPFPRNSTQAAANKHIKDLLVSVDMSTLVMPTELLCYSGSCNYNPIPSIRRVIYEFIPDYDELPDSYRHGLSAPELFEEAILQNMHKLAQRVQQLALNACEIAVHCCTPFQVSIYMAAIDFQLQNNVAALICRLPVRHIYILGASLSDPVAQHAAMSQIQSLVMRYQHGTGAGIELAIRNCRTLERLHIDISEQPAVTSGLVIDEAKPHCTRIFPRLRHLVITQNSHRWPPPAIIQQHGNPFPVLKTLVSQGKFPFHLSPILTGNYSHLRYLDIELDPELFPTLQQAHILDAGTFRQLYFVRLGWASSYHQNFTADIAHALAGCAASLSSTTRVLKLISNSSRATGAGLAVMQFPLHLQRLELHDNALSIDQLVQLLAKLQHLQVATVGLMQDSRMDDAADLIIQEYRQRYADNGASIYELRITNPMDFGFTRKAEGLVLLAALLSNLRKIRFNISSHQLLKFKQVINCIRERLVYGDVTRLASVQFLSLSEIN